VLHERFHFTVDVAASDRNHKLPRYHTRSNNGLTASWAGERVYCNQVSPFLRSAAVDREGLGRAESPALGATATRKPNRTNMVAGLN
jgi:hypothetical protein